MSNTGAGTLTGAGSFIQGANSTLVYAGSTISVGTFTASASGNTVNYSGTTPTILAVTYYSLTFSGSGTVALASPNIAGDLTVSTGTLNLTGTAVFNGSGTTVQNINGNGTITFVNLTLNTGTGNVNANRSISISGALLFSTNRIMTVNSTSNVTFTTSGSFSSTARVFC